MTPDRGTLRMRAMTSSMIPFIRWRSGSKASRIIAPMSRIDVISSRRWR
jgi:hypothetical protein